MTYLDQKIMFTINSNEFLEQAWIRSERKEKSPHIVIMTKRFNDVSQGIYRLDRGVFLKISSYFSTCQTQNLIILLWHRGLLFQIYNLHKIALYEPTSPSPSQHTKLWRTCKTLILSQEAINSKDNFPGLFFNELAIQWKSITGLLELNDIGRGDWGSFVKIY